MVPTSFSLTVLTGISTNMLAKRGRTSQALGRSRALGMSVLYSMQWAEVHRLGQWQTSGANAICA